MGSVSTDQETAAAQLLRQYEAITEAFARPYAEHAGRIIAAVNEAGEAYLRQASGVFDAIAIALLPVPGDRVKCGLRTDLPKKQRRHSWVSLGPDTRNRGEHGFKDCEILACRECGTDKAVAL